MGYALSANYNRPIGNRIRLEFETRPVCMHCSEPMKIRHSSKPRLIIGLYENHYFQKAYYQCKDKLCQGSKDPYLIPENSYIAPKADYMYEVYAKICELRWKERNTYKEIMKKLSECYDITICIGTIEISLKIYEIGSATKYRPKYIKKIKDNGGVIATIDGMKPMNGNSSLYSIYDYNTGLTLGSCRPANQSAELLKLFIRKVKQRVEKELDSKIIAVISDALPSQRIAIEEELPDAKHCLCHYHFYNLVLKESKELDSNLLTQVRSSLKGLYDLKKYVKFKLSQSKTWVPCEFLEEILKVIEGLAKWKRRPKDPCFSGLVLYSRVKDIRNMLEKAEEMVDLGIVSCADDKILKRLYKQVNDIFNQHQAKASELKKIDKTLKKLKDVLDDIDCSFNEGLKKLADFNESLKEKLINERLGKIEKTFIEAMIKYFDTKSNQLLNYKLISGAPRTNNSHEIRYKQLKHLLRRVIGFSSAKYYLLNHGERLVYIDPEEPYENILEILKNTNFCEAQKIIRSERTSRDCIQFVMHHTKKWARTLKNLWLIFKKQEEPLCIIN